MADGLPFLRCCIPQNICDGLLSFIGGNTTAVVPRQNKFYLFNSHSHDCRGLYVSDSTSVLFRFHDLLEVERHIQVVYLDFREYLYDFIFSLNSLK